MNINTINTKQQQLQQGYFEVGSGIEKILIIGSCRSVPYVQYLHDWDKDNRFTIRFIDPFNFLYDLNDNRVNMQAKIDSLQVDNRMLRMLNETDICLHEWYANYGMFNFDHEAEKNIYQFGLDPKTDLCIPSFNDKFILTTDIVAFDTEIRKKAIADYNVTGKLTDETLAEVKAVSDANIKKFFDVCEMSDFQGFGKYFKHSYKQVRYWHNSNHVTKWFTITIMMLICEQIGIELTDEFVEQLKDTPDMYANIFTPLTEYDDFYWGEEIKSLRECL